MASPKPADLDSIEQQTQTIGRYLWQHLDRGSPSVFDRRWWDDRILSWAMADEAVKVQMFRFIDVLPMLRSHDAITRHLHEYFNEVADHFPNAARLAVDVTAPGTVLGRAVASTARRNAVRMAQRFIAGHQAEDVLQSLARLRKKGFAFTLDLLGESIISEDEADRYQQEYLRLIERLSPTVNHWPDNFQLDCDHLGRIPRLNVSLKLSALYSQFNPNHPSSTLDAVKNRLRPILRAVQEHGAHLHIDMEQYAFKDMTLAIVRSILTEAEFRDFEDVGIVIQAYLPDAGRDLAVMNEWVEKRGAPIWVRLVKGAYWDYETVVASARGWPVPVYQRKWQSDVNYEEQTRFLMQNWKRLRPAFGSHNLRSLAHALACAKEMRVPEGAYEIQMLYGMGGEQAQLFANMGKRVRIYTPFGDLIPGMAYLVRRLLENTSNSSFLRSSFAENVNVDLLFQNPSLLAEAEPPVTTENDNGWFQNEPPTDFGNAENRAKLEAALEHIEDDFDRVYPLVIGGRRFDTRSTIVSKNPSRKRKTIGASARATAEHARDVVVAARSAFRSWSRTPVDYRAEYLELAARKMQERKPELTAWIITESGKPWTEADADVAEAIDFLKYYAAQMRTLDQPLAVDIPGEENRYQYRPRGVAVVIAPWNFPLAILTGMTAAALVAGNTVVMKPAEQSPVVAAKLLQIFEESGLPDGVLNYLPGIGEEVGPTLVSHPDVDLVAFTGSQAVGLGIHEQAAQTETNQRSIRKVIAELGGKNAIIVDDDANLDEAVLGVVQSAFGYAGQKCSACSRVIVLDGAYDEFIRRLAPAVASLVIGPADSAATFVGPVIDAEAKERIEQYIAIGMDEAKLLVAGDAAAVADQGFYVAPHVFVDVAPDSRLAQDEVFGPVLVVMKARSFDHALELANGTRFALTAGLYSRSPVNLKRARLELDAGNLYLNRPITGAMVHRHPFGGFKLSGIGSKAGGPDYLQQFLIPVSVSENTLRRGFAPEAK